MKKQRQNNMGRESGLARVTKKKWKYIVELITLLLLMVEFAQV